MYVFPVWSDGIPRIITSYGPTVRNDDNIWSDGQSKVYLMYSNSIARAKINSGLTEPRSIQGGLVR
jgi:hypothetical protein